MTTRSAPTRNGEDPLGSAQTTREVEEVIARLQGVQQARVVQGEGGRLAEVHVLAGRDRAPKQLVRDVQSVLMARFGIDLDYRTVSVVQLDEPPHETIDLRDGPRPAITRISASSDGRTSRVECELALGGRTRAGAAQGPSVSGARLVALAVVDAVGDLLGQSVVDVDFAMVLAAGPHQIAIAVLRVVTPRGDHVVSGSAVVRKDANDAMARAVLSALNRQMQTG